MEKRTYRGKLSFNAADVLQRNQVNIDLSGLSMPIPADFAAFSKEFEGYSRDRLAFGWGGNDPKFHGDVNNNIQPKPEDFVEVPFRLISATIVGGGTWKATDFSNVAVLKKSRQLLDGKTVYKDHETDTDNWVGLVNGVKWTEGFKSNGVDVPAGIDGILAIDKITNPKVARGCLMGTIYSNSVTVEFDWEMSHTFEREWDFLDKIGEIGSDGKMVRRIVTAIYNYHETSLVWLGADPFAKAYDADNNLKNIDIGSVYKFSKVAVDEEPKLTETTKETYTKNKVYAVGLGFDKNLVPLSKKTLDLSPTHKNKTVMDKKFIAAFVATFGKQLNITEADFAEDKNGEELLGHFTKLGSTVSDYAKASEALGKVQEMALAVVKEKDATATTVDLVEFAKTHSFVDTAALATLKTEAGKVPTLELEAAAGRTFLAAKKVEAVRLYKATVGDKADEAVIELFNKADDKALNGLIKQYTKGATEKFAGHCADCGSANFEFKSSMEIEDPNPVVKTTDVSFNSIYKQLHKPSMTIGKKADS